MRAAPGWPVKRQRSSTTPTRAMSTALLPVNVSTFPRTHATFLHSSFIRNTDLTDHPDKHHRARAASACPRPHQPSEHSRASQHHRAASGPAMSVRSRAAQQDRHDGTFGQCVLRSQGPRPQAPGLEPPTATPLRPVLLSNPGTGRPLCRGCRRARTPETCPCCGPPWCPVREVARPPPPPPPGPRFPTDALRAPARMAVASFQHTGHAPRPPGIPASKNTGYWDTGQQKHQMLEYRPAGVSP